MDLQKIRPLLLMKRRSAYMQRINSSTWALTNKLGDDTWPGGGFGIRAVTISAIAATNNIVVCFSEEPASTLGFDVGVTIKTNGGA